jgi:hypothetical protein
MALGCRGAGGVHPINQDRRRQATNISYIKTFRDDGAEVFKAIFRRHVAFMLANENVVTLSAIARTKGCEPIVPIIAALAFVEEAGGDHSKLVCGLAFMRDPGEFSVSRIQGV